MTDLPAFLRGIRSKPDDDVRRLAFADWLDERGDPAWAEFVRLQCEIEPVRGQYDLPGVFANEKQERELLRANEKRWLAPGDGLPDAENPSIPRFGFRRGVVEIVRMSVADWLAHGEAVLAAFPTVRELVVFHARGECRDLARSDQLRHLDGLEIADWITPDDAGGLCRATVPELRTLRTRIGIHNRPESAVAMEIHNAGAFRGLRTWEMIQLYGGVAVVEGAAVLDFHADEFAEAASELFEGSPDVRVVRPFEQLFPLGPRDGDGDIGYGITAGRLRGTTPAIINEWDVDEVYEFELITFGRNDSFREFRTEGTPRPERANGGMTGFRKPSGSNPARSPSGNSASRTGTSAFNSSTRWTTPCS